MRKGLLGLVDFLPFKLCSGCELFIIIIYYSTRAASNESRAGKRWKNINSPKNIGEERTSDE